MDAISPRTTAPVPLPAVKGRSDDSAASRPRVPPRIFGGASVVVGGMVLLGWLFDVPALRALGPADQAATNPTAAFMFLLGGGALWLASDPQEKSRQLSRTICLTVAVLALGCWADQLAQLGLGLDQLLFRGAMASTPDGRDNRMAPATAMGMLLYALAMLWLVRRSDRAGLAQSALVASLLIAVTTLLGLIFRAGWFEGAGAVTRMARPSAATLAMLSLGALTLRPNAGLMLVLTSDGPGGTLARRLLPAGFIIPVLTGLILLNGRRSNVVEADLAIMLFVLASITTFTALIGWNATLLHDSHVERARAEERLRDSEVRFRLLAENASDVVSLHDLDGRVLYVSPSCERVFGFTPEEMGRMRPFSMVHPEDRAKATAYHEALLRGEPVPTLTCRKLHKSGRHVWVETSWRPILNRAGKIVRLQASSRDVTERREYERQLEEAHAKVHAQRERLIDANSRLEALASLDSLTGLKNRRSFEERLHAEISRTRRSKESFALLLLDIDHFKHFNDSFGHPRGDEVLKSVARVLSRSARDADFIARYGGEEFAIILPDTDREGAKLMGERLREAIEINAWDVRPITVSVGAAAWTDGASAEALVDQADRALYRSKQAGRNIVTLADAA